MSDTERNRRINALLAVHLFGWVPMNKENGYSPDVCDLRQRYPNYLTWEGMGLVVEAMQAREWSLRLDVHRFHRCFADFRSGDPGRFGPASADTAPEAVAVGALHALGVDVPDVDVVVGR